MTTSSHQAARPYACVLVMAFSITVLAACVPGGMFMPVPVSHVDRPVIRGVLLESGQPAPGRTVEAVGYIDRPPQSCEKGAASAVTSTSGVFEIVGDKDLVTLWWGTGTNGVVLCVPDTDSVWSMGFARTELPPFIPEEIEVNCDLLDGHLLNCIPADNDVTGNEVSQESSL